MLRSKSSECPVNFSSPSAVCVSGSSRLSRFLARVSVGSGFDWLCFVASVLFVVGFARFSKSACLFLAEVLVKVKATLF